MGFDMIIPGKKIGEVYADRSTETYSIFTNYVNEYDKNKAILICKDTEKSRTDRSYRKNDDGELVYNFHEDYGQRYRIAFPDLELLRKEIDKIIDNSKDCTISAEWFVPCDSRKYDVINAFHELGRVDWKQNANIEVGDIVYICYR